MQVNGQEAKLPGLAAVDHFQRTRVYLHVAWINVRSKGCVLLSPRRFNGLRRDTKHLFDERSKWATTLTLGLKHFITLLGRYDVVLYE